MKDTYAEVAKRAANNKAVDEKAVAAIDLGGADIAETIAVSSRLTLIEKTHRKRSKSCSRLCKICVVCDNWLETWRWSMPTRKRHTMQQWPD